MLHKLLNAIQNPVEMRLLPHIVREWHRRGFPIKMNDAHKISKLSYQLNQPEIVLQMSQLDVYGICYDLEGIREVVRALARRASTLPWIKDDKPFSTEEMLRSTPKLLQCAVGMDAKKALNDPVVLGTQFWALTRKFMDDPGFRTPKQALELCDFADWLVLLLNEGQIVAENPQQPRSPYFVAYGVRQHAQTALYDYIPVQFALQQFVNIMLAPWSRCDKVYRPVDMTRRDNKSRLRQFLDEMNDGKANLFDTPSLRNQFWLINHQFLIKAVRERKIELSDLEPWQWAILKQYAPAPKELDKFLTVDRKEYFTPDTERYHLILHAKKASQILGKAIGRLRHTMKMSNTFERRHTFFNVKPFVG